MPSVSISLNLFFDCTLSPYLLLGGSLCSSVWSSAPAEGFAPESVSSGPPDAPEHNTAEMIIVYLITVASPIVFTFLSILCTTSDESCGRFLGFFQMHNHDWIKFSASLI